MATTGDPRRHRGGRWPPRTRRGRPARGPTHNRGAGQGGAQDRVYALISGGGSAPVPVPRSPVTLADKQQLNRLHLTSGQEIGQVNLIRQHLSDLNG